MNPYIAAGLSRRKENAVTAVLDADYRTQDIASPGQRSVSTREMGDLVAESLAEHT